MALGRAAPAVLMTQRVWGSEDKGVVEPPQSARLMPPFQPARSAAECAKRGGPGPVGGPRAYKNAGEALLPDIDYTGSVPHQYRL